jgi:hypothetical protein
MSAWQVCYHHCNLGSRMHGCHSAHPYWAIARHLLILSMSAQDAVNNMYQQYFLNLADASAMTRGKFHPNCQNVSPKDLVFAP